MGYRYYSTMRPVSLGTFPKTQKVLNIENFDDRVYVDKIGREAWGYIEYAEPILNEHARIYELVKGF